LVETSELRADLVALYREVQPSVVLTHAARDPYNDDHAVAHAIALRTRVFAQAPSTRRRCSASSRDESAAQILSGLYHVLEQGIAVSASIDLGEEAVSLAVRTGDQVAERRARINLGAFYNNARRPADAIPHLQHGIELARAQGVASSEAAGHCNLGVAYKAMNDRDRALAAFLAADALRPDAPNSAVLNNIGNAYSLRGDFELAGTYLQRALSVAQSTGIRSDESLSLLNLGDVDFIRGNYELALDRLHAAYDLAREIGNSRLQLYADQALAKINKGLDRIEASRLHLNRALDLARATGDVHREQTILGDIDQIAMW
jgi:tetratricopeptide (TPR) repeat protein